MSPASVLVTGGAGFIGGHLAEAFLRRGHDVTVVDNLQPFYDVGIKRHTIERCRVIADDNPNTAYAFIEEDLRNHETITDLLTENDFDYIYHQAAQAGVRHSLEHPQQVHDVNATATLNLLEAARHADITRVICASSSSVYGKPIDLPYDETHPTEPVSPYGASKLAAEHYARIYYEVYGLPAVSTRYFTVYGPRMRPNMAISNFVSRGLTGEPPVVYGDGTQIRDFTYIDDVVEANLRLLATDRADGEVLNVGSTDTIDIRTLAETVRDQLDPSLDIEFAPRPPGDADATHADVSKARELLDYEPTVDIHEGIERYIAWYKDNRDWYEPLVLNS